MDFFQIHTKEKRTGREELYPVFIVNKEVEDLMVRGGSFYAIWDQEKGFWSTNPYDAQRLIDDALWTEAKKHPGTQYDVKVLLRSDTGYWKKFLEYMKNAPNNYHQLDAKLAFANTKVSKRDYASKKLPYSLEEGDISAWEELVSTLYGPEERKKIEWAIGSIVAGDSKKIQKFIVFYGSAGTGKSTMLNVIQKLFEGYCTAFDGKALGSGQASFATEAFKNNPLVAIEHDADLSRIDTNTRLNSIIAHEEMLVNEKYKASYPIKLDTMLFLGSNQPVKISDAKSGLIRRLIDIHPTGSTIPRKRFDSLMHRINFELGAIAHHCLQTYLSMGPNYYNRYRPLEMMLQTDVFFNFIEANYDVFKAENRVTLGTAYKMYKEFCEESGIDKPMPQYKMREELRNYFDSYNAGERVYKGFNANRFKHQMKEGGFSLVLTEIESIFDEEMWNQPAQLAREDGTPSKKWSTVTTTLRDLDTKKTHYVKPPPSHIVIDFDLQDAGDKRALERNLEAASMWPPTYAEVSKGGEGIHLHYNYTGEVGELGHKYQDGIEVKTFSGDAALRRRLSLCNSVPIASISEGLPLKEKKEKMLKDKTIASEQGLRALIERNLHKEFHAGTKPSVDFIKKILDDAHESDMAYDVTDLRPRIVAFANNSTNQASAALKVVRTMKWTSNGDKGDESTGDVSVKADDDRIVFFDVEVYPNLFVICWKFQGSDQVVRMVNPSAEDVAKLFKLKLVGFYNRRFDNHILWAASMGASNEELFRLTQKLIVDGNRGATFGSAYGISYADIWDFSVEKMSLKKFEIKLGILHMELDLPWDQPVDQKDWDRVVEYCANDVRATEAVFEDRKSDFVARQILAELSGMTVNDTTQTHAARIIFGNDKHPQKKFVYTDLSKEFPGYTFDLGKSSYRGENPGEGGYVYAEPGIYENVAVLDVVSMHPRSIEILNLFGPYTKNYAALTEARVAIKHQNYDRARELLDGRLAKFLVGAENDTAGQHGTALSFALRIALNIVYGLTSAKFDNPFRDIRNKDNIVAKRGALYMLDLKHDLRKAEKPVIHIKTDSVKIPNATPNDITFVLTHGLMYRYEFELEVIYNKFCLVNDAVYIARKNDEWTAVGAQFQHPYVFKTLFSGEEVDFQDYCEARSVNKGTMYLDIRGSDMDQPDYTKMRHVGKTGLFVPVTGSGGILYRVHEEKYYAVSGTKGHLWMEAHIAKEMGDKVQIDMSYFDKLKDDAISTIEQFGSFEEFVR